MNKFLGRFLSVAILLVSGFAAFAQDTVPRTFDDTMRSHGKIYVVMAVCLLILIVLLVYLIRIDLKLSAKEKNQ